MGDIKGLTIVVRDRPLDNHDAIAVAGGASMLGYELLKGAFTVSEGYAFHRKSGERRGRFQADRIASAIRFYREAGGSGKPFSYKMWSETDDWVRTWQEGEEDGGLSIHGQLLFRHVNGKSIYAAASTGVGKDDYKRIAFDLKRLEDFGYAKRAEEDTAMLTKEGMLAASEMAVKVNGGDVEKAVEDLGISAALALTAMNLERWTDSKDVLVKSGAMTEKEHAEAFSIMMRAGRLLSAFRNQSEEES